MQKAAIAAALLLVGCAQVQKFTPVTVTVHDVESATQSAAQALTVRGYTVDSAAAGTVTSEWFERKDAIGSVYRLRWVIVVRGDRATVDLQCRYGDGSLKGDDCGEMRPPSDKSWQAIAHEISLDVL